MEKIHCMLVWYFSAGRREWGTGTLWSEGTNATVWRDSAEKKKDGTERRGIERQAGEKNHHAGVTDTHIHTLIYSSRKEERLQLKCYCLSFMFSSNSNSSKSRKDDGEDGIFVILLMLQKVAGRLEPISADIGQPASYTLERLPVHHSIQTNNHSHSYSHLWAKLACCWFVWGNQSTWRQATYAWGEHANFTHLLVLTSFLYFVSM